MTDTHQDARKLAMAVRIGDANEDDRQRLENHLAECVTCAQAVEALDSAIAGIRADAVTADARLVRSTQALVRHQACLGGEERARMRPLWIASTMVCVCALASTVIAWEFFAWTTRWLWFSDMAWRMAMVLLWFAPGLAASCLLLGYGSHRGRWAATSVPGAVESA